MTPESKRVRPCKKQWNGRKHTLAQSLLEGSHGVEYYLWSLEVVLPRRNKTKKKKPEEKFKGCRSRTHTPRQLVREMGILVGLSGLDSYRNLLEAAIFVVVSGNNTGNATAWLLATIWSFIRARLTHNIPSTWVFSMKCPRKMLLEALCSMHIESLGAPYRCLIRDRIQSRWSKWTFRVHMLVVPRH